MATSYSGSLYFSLVITLMDSRIQWNSPLLRHLMLMLPQMMSTAITVSTILEEKPYIPVCIGIVIL